MSGDNDKRPVIPTAQIVYGEIVYWITILAAIVCMVGPLLAVADEDNNLLNPHFVFAHIFNEEEPGGVWALSANVEPVLPAVTRNVPDAKEWEALGVHEAVEVLAALPVPDRDADCPEFEIGGKLRIIRNPAERAEEFTLVTTSHGESKTTDVTPRKARAKMLDIYKDEVVSDGHFWMAAPLTGDGFAQLGLALGCSVALWGLIIAAFLFLRQKVILYTGLALWVAGLVFISAAGVVNLH